MTNLIFVKDSEGRRKLGPLVYIMAALLVIIPSILYYQNRHRAGLMQMSRRQAQQNAPSPFQTPESDLTRESELPNVLARERDRELQIAREQSSALRPEELEERTRQIEQKYKEKARQQSKTAMESNFMQRLLNFNAPPQPPPAEDPQTPDAAEAPASYIPFSERMAAEGKEATTQPANKAMVFEKPKFPPPDAEQDPPPPGSPEREPEQKDLPDNILPLGTFIPCVLESDVISTDLQAHVWASVAQDVYFRRRLQIPKGLVKLRGKAAREPVHNLLDIAFDVMVFSDGTELPISGFAYSAFDIRYPDRTRVRGLPGELVTPPLYTKLLQILYSSILSASDTYISNFVNENTTQENLITPVITVTPTASQPSTIQLATSQSSTQSPIIDPTTGQPLFQTSQNLTQTPIAVPINPTGFRQTQRGPVNSRIGTTMALNAGRSLVEGTLQQLLEDLERYRPYVKLQKGTPLFVQLENTVDISERQINGVAIAAERQRQMRSEFSSARPSDPDIYPPGDARHRYDGRAQTPSILNPPGAGLTPTTQDITRDMLNALAAQNDPRVQSQMQQQRQRDMAEVNRLLEQIRNQRPQRLTPSPTSPPADQP